MIWEDLPESLKKVVPKIKFLNLRGDESLLEASEKKLAIVGSRRMTEYGRRVLEIIVPELVQNKIIIVSGMMYGVDQTAHQLCMKYGGKTIAVLGWGIDTVVADEDMRMQEKIIESGGLLVSEWKEKKGEVWTFPLRNRIVAGLADAVLVIEAAEKSGSMVTVGWAEKFKKSILAVPGPITCKTSSGTNKIIAMGRARPITSAGEILCSIWGGNEENRQLCLVDGDKPQGLGKRVELALGNDTLTTDELCKILHEKSERVTVALLELSLSNVVMERAGKWTRVIR